MSAAPTLIFTDPIFLAHEPGGQHPESPSRLRAILDLDARAPIPGTEKRVPRAATDDEILAVHGASHLGHLRALSGQNAQLDEDTISSPRSFEAAVRAAGAAVGAVEAVFSGEAQNAFVWARPPGHHAEKDAAMGFCLLNNAAIAAEAGRRLGAERVLVLDWDVHHGNGTQHLFESRRDVLYMSAHEWPLYPGTGAPQEVGVGAGAGYTVNCALPPGQEDADYGAVFEDLFLPIAHAYRPELVIVSAGFDAHAFDPLADMRLGERGFAAMCAALRDLAVRHAGGRLVLLLEGGYDLGALGASVHACVEVMTGRNESFPAGVHRAGAAIAASRAALRGHFGL